MIVTERQPDLPFMIPKHGRLPGIAPVDEQDWIATPDDLCAQLQYRDDLIGKRPDNTIRLLREGTPPALELLDMLLTHLADRDGWVIEAGVAQRPDGQHVRIDRNDPMRAIGRLVSEDFCILAKPREKAEYVLVGAALCFPAGWRLSDKIGRPLTDIHGPVPYYDDDLAKRVNRIFDGIKAEQILLRFNWSVPTNPDLHAPPGAFTSHEKPVDETTHYLRVERQTLRRLPNTDAVAFGIRTTVSPLRGLKPEEARRLLDELNKQDAEMTEYKDGSVHAEQTRAFLRSISAT